METGKRMTDVANSLNDVQSRAAFFAVQAVPGPHKTKRLASILECSTDMAWRLRRGEGWTVSRLEIASRRFGWSFVNFVFGPVTGGAGGPSNALAAEIAELETVVSRLATAWRAGPRDLVGAGVVDGGTVRPAVVAAGKAGASHGEGSDGSRLRGGDSARHPVMAQSIKRAAE